MHRHFRAGGNAKQIPTNLDKILLAGYRTVDSHLRGNDGVFLYFTDFQWENLNDGTLGGATGRSMLKEADGATEYFSCR
ncbi:hypothetical protein [Conchiformibius kuhniae]|uniref:Uncharacterized protein n=1 Tax=Conchiformibius kuhniae TaxID=211502 RepID=A0A8T9MXQ6_9NEIS|nr:hypothetical protein [Conchiformibius kuhniae]UOP05206.1 hypothetical protein LVJ77_02935 [Conchiformibius kuhniae]